MDGAQVLDDMLEGCPLSLWCLSPKDGGGLIPPPPPFLYLLYTCTHE